MRTHLFGALVISAALMVAGCGSSETGSAPSGSSAADPAAFLNPYNASDLTKMITDAGLPLPNLHDATAQDCPRIGCTDKLDADPVSVMTFPNTGSAQRYVGATRHSFQLFNIAMVFAPSVTPDRQHAYEDVVTHAVQ